MLPPLALAQRPFMDMPGEHACMPQDMRASMRCACVCAGKLDLYVAAAGFHPSKVLPVVLDVGTQNMGLRDDPLYIGLDQDRLNGDEYYEVYHLSLCNAIAAVKAVSPILRLC